MKYSAQGYSLKTKLVLGFCLFNFVMFSLPNIPLPFSLNSFVVLTKSMEPALPVGSLVYVRKAQAYSRGDIVTFKNSAGQVVTHRVIDDSLNSYLTKGDANIASDEEVITSKEVIGKSFFVVPFIGGIILFMKSIQGFLLITFLPLALFISYEILKLKKETNNSHVRFQD